MRRGFVTVATTAVLVTSAVGAVGATRTSRASTSGWPVVVRQDGLVAVSCAASTFCMASAKFDWSRKEALFERWNGATWARLSAPVTAGVNATTPYVTSVSCVATTFCLAVGQSADVLQCISGVPGCLSSARPLVMSWDGTSWSEASNTGLAGLRAGRLSGLACATRTWCVAVGYTAIDFNHFLPFTAVWKGSSWTVIPGPVDTDPNHQTSLNGVSCPSQDSCTAVGETLDLQTDTSSTVIWSMRAGLTQPTWEAVPSPNHPTYGHNTLNGVSCTSATTCTAVGTATTVDNHGSFSQPLIEAIDIANGRSAWSLETGPANGGLNAVSCPSATSCTAVGSMTLESLPAPTASHRAWTVVPSPPQLTSVSCVPGTAKPLCVAVA